MLTQERAKEMFDYRPDGVLLWRKRHRRVTLDAPAGGFTTAGYKKVGIDKRVYPIHRVVWLWHYGYFPENPLDHINRKKADNRIENLREVSHTCNLRNTGNQTNCTSGTKGVSWNKRDRRWVAQIKVGGMYRYMGNFVCYLEAACHRLAAEQALGWSGCDSSSPAFQYVKRCIFTIK